MNILLKAACACLAALSTAAAMGATPAGWAPLNLLDGRLTARVPPGAQAQSVSPGIMAGELPHARQERVVVELERGVRLTVFVTELFRLARPDMAATEHAFAQQIGTALKISDLGEGPVYEKPEGLAIVFLRPSEFAPVDDALFIGAALVRQKDGTLQSLAFFANAAGAEMPTELREMATRVSESLVPGPRALQSGGRFGTAGWPFEVELPAGYTAYAQRGPDFDVYRLLRLAFIDETASELGIYVGAHPQKRSAPANAVSVNRPLLGRPVQWWFWTGAVARAETYFQALGTAKLSGHAFVIAAGAAEREALVDAVSRGKLR